MERERINNLITGFLNNELDDRGKSEVLAWVKESEANQEEFKRIHNAFQAEEITSLQKTVRVDSAWNKLRDGMPVVENRKVIRLNNLWKVAATVAILISISLTAYIFTNKPTASQSNPVSALLQFEAPKGQKSKVILADGTTVWLNSGSQLKYDAAKSRQVSLIGEAYFDVKHDRKNPFEITTHSGQKVLVLGTKFNLKAYASERVIETTLEEGKVRFLGKDNEIISKLKPGEQVLYNIDSGEASLNEVDPELYSLWKNNILKFENMMFEDIVKRMERWYGVTIELDPKLEKSARFTMTIKTESLRELLTMMRLTADFRYSIEGEEVRISSK